MARRHLRSAGIAPWGACARLAGVIVLAASLGARGQPKELPRMPPQKAGPSGAAGKVIQFEEKPAAGVIYHEQSGGMMSPLPPAPPVPERTPKTAPPPRAPAATAAQKAPTPAVATVEKAPAKAASSPSGQAAARKPAPAEVARAPAAPSWGDLVDKANDAGDTKALVALGADPRMQLECDKAYRSWVIARAYEESGDVPAATRILDPLLTTCRDPIVRATTLEIGRELVEPETLSRWLKREAPNERSGEAAQRFDRMAIADALAQNQVSKVPARQRAPALEKEIGEAVVRFRDADSASSLGWAWLEAGDPATAALWFSRAQTWVPGDETVLRGLSYAAMQERRFDDALRHASGMAEGEEKNKILRDAYVAKADSVYNMERFAETLALLGRAAEYAPLPRHGRELEAWSFSRTGRKAEAAKRFAALYRESPDRGAAEGLLAAYDNKTMIDADLRASEPLAGMLRTELAIASFNASRFIEAAALDPRKYGEVGGVHAPQVSGYVGGHKKTGEDGLSKFKSHRTYAAEAGTVVAEGVALKLRLETHEIRSGTPAASALIGSAPANAPLPQPIEETKARVDEGRLLLRVERGLAINAHLGVTSAEAGLAQRAIGGVEVETAPTWGFGAFGIAREPVRESILAYAGMKDPHGEQSWGRVARDVIGGRALVLHAPWSIGASGRVARITGVNVQSNRQRTAELSVGYNAELTGFAYASTSLSVSGDQYDRNLGNYTLGHGGYFSPQRYRRVGAAFDFMTAENRQWLVRGRLTAGLISKRVDEAPFLPLAPDGRVYPGSPTSRANDAAGNVLAVARINKYLQVAGGISRSMSPQWSENHVFVQLRVLLEPRASVVSADLGSFVR